MSLYDPKEFHTTCLQAAKEAIGQAALPAAVEKAFEDYAASLRVSPRKMRNAELNLDRVIAKDIDTLGGWEKAGPMREAYKTTLNALLPLAIDEAHAHCMKAAKTALSQYIPNKDVPPEMASALKRLIPFQLFPGKFNDLAARRNARRNAIEITDTSSNQLTLPCDDGRESPAYHRASMAHSAYVRALDSIVSKNHAAALS